MQKQKIINQIMEGKFDYENGSLDFSCAKIEISVKKGGQYEGAFRVKASPGIYVNGSVYSSDWRMECLTKEFSGAEEEIAFRFHGENLDEGEVVKGTFDIVSNQGEYYLPFVAAVEHALPESSEGTVKNLFHFANLAKSNWKEAVKLFYSPEFGRIFSGSDAQYGEDYRALSAHRGQEQNVEEFLIQVNKKQRTEYLTEEQELSLAEAAGTGGVAEQKLTVLRNGWGFTQLFVQCRGDFLFSEKDVLTDDDFLGDRCELPVFIDFDQCHNGRNFGEIVLYNSYVALAVPVTVHCGHSAFGTQDAERKRCTVRLMEAYQNFRLRKTGTSAWLKETGRLVERLVALNEEDISARLFQAQLLVTEERYNEAGWILDHVAERLEGREDQDTLLAYYLYLTTLVHGDGEYIDKVAGDVRRIFRRDTSNWRVAWLLLYLSEELNRSDREKWGFLEELFLSGCRSPVLYIEALVPLNANPALLRRLGSFEQQVIYYGVRQGVLKKGVVEQMLYLAGRLKEYSQALFRTMELLYEKKKDIQLLQEICTLLIKGGKIGKAYAGWYMAGVDAQLRITNLYEYFCMSLDPDGRLEIPKTVLKYFSYQNNLDYTRSAYLYDDVLQHRERLGDVAEAYQYKMEQFVEEQIRKGHINRHLASLYNGLLRQDMVDGRNAEALSRLLFAHLIRVEDDRLQKVYVYQQGNLRPHEYILSEKQTWISLYGSGYTIVFEDGQKNRFLKSADYTMEKLMIPGKFLRWILPFADMNPELDFYLCDGEENCREEHHERVRRELRLLACGQADLSVRRRLYLSIAQRYHDMDDMRALDEFLETIPAGELSWEERGTVIRFMVQRGKLELAWQWVETYGPYFVDAKILVRLVKSRMEKQGMGTEPLLTAAAVYVFQKGKYDGTTLAYLSAHYEGMTRNLRDLWRAAHAFGMDCYELSEKMLIQMLYSGAFVGEKMEIFRYYIAQGAKTEVEEAFLAQCSYDCFVRERVMEKEVFREIRYMYSRGEPVQRICRLAFLKYFAENRHEMDGETVKMAGELLEEMLAEGIYLDFFRKFRECRDQMQEMADKTVLEYRTRPRTKVCVHYALLHENGEADGYRSEYMKEVYGGVYFKAFVLFFGESLQYYVTEEADGEAQLTESGTLQKGETGEEEDGRYRLINDIVTARSLQDYDTMDDLLEEYYKKEFLNGKLFSVK